MSPTSSATVLSLLMLAAATLAVAQTPGGPGGSRGTMSGGREGMRPDTMRGESAPGTDAPLVPGALVQRQLDALEDEIKPGTPEQREAWGAYAGALQKLADAVARGRFEARASSTTAMPATEQFDRIASGMRTRAALVDEIAGLGRSFYATLTSEQKTIADQHLAQPLMLLATGVSRAPMPEAMGRGGRRRGR